MRTRSSRRTLVLAGVALGSLVVAASLTLALPHMGEGAMPASSSPHAAGSRAEFAYLSGQTSNHCSLDPDAVFGYRDSMRLQGSCCDAMDMVKYQSQVVHLRRYRSIDAIPLDPYDISIALAKRLLTYDKTLHLSAAEHAAYNRAMEMTGDKGPCCCHCWRWNATAGLAKYLILDRRFHAREVARVVDLVNGCGGTIEHPAPVRA